MEKWQLDFEWLRVQHHVRHTMGHNDLPGLQPILLLIGIQELGYVKHQFSKEEKQDLMHVAVCTLLSTEDYYRFEGRDQDGWPHFQLQRPLDFGTVEQQETMLKEKIVEYFSQQELVESQENVLDI